MILMATERASQKHAGVLADVAEMYYIEGKDQSAIASEVGVTRSMISRMLTEARSRGIVEIKVIRPIHSDHELEDAIKTRFGIESVFVVSMEDTKPEKLLNNLGRAAAEVLKKHLRPDLVIGVAWGTAVSATVDAVQTMGEPSIKVIQLVGAQGARNVEYDGHAIVKRLAEKIGGEGYYINAPYLCQTPEIAQSMRETRGIKETIDMGKETQVALLGVGTTEIEFSSYYLSGLLTEEEIEAIQKNGVVGDIASNYFNMDGTPYYDDFLSRMITIRLEDLNRIPVRIGIAGGSAKVKAIIGALNSRLVNHLVTDSNTARLILN
jgi:DNA-binding transcriptional regulator LsrR (DeoR family)